MEITFTVWIDCAWKYLILRTSSLLKLCLPFSVCCALSILEYGFSQAHWSLSCFWVREAKSRKEKPPRILLRSWICSGSGMQTCYSQARKIQDEILMPHSKAVSGTSFHRWWRRGNGVFSWPAERQRPRSRTGLSPARFEKWLGGWIHVYLLYWTQNRSTLWRTTSSVLSSRTHASEIIDPHEKYPAKQERGESQ